MIGSSTMMKPAAAAGRARLAAATRVAAAPRAPLVPRRSVAARAGNVAPALRQEIEDLLSQNRVVVFMKGTKSFPMCGFSGTVVQILKSLSVSGAEVPFFTVNILEREDLRVSMKEYSQWPTFPQVYIDGEFFGGCDIMLGEFLFFFRRARAGQQQTRSHHRSLPFKTNTTTDAYQSGELQETIERVMAA
jgi:monothiol glutaredoxin